VGVYAGSPSSLVRDAKTGKSAGVTHDLGTALAQEFGVPVRVVEFERLALVLDALKAGQVDMTFTNATETRARDVDFTPTLLQVDLGFLVPAGSRLTGMADVDQTGMQVGVSQGSSSQAALPQVLKAATLLPASSLLVAQQMLQGGQIQAFATNKGILFELSDALPGSRVLDGRWGVERMAIAIPKGRESALPYLRRFGQQLRDSGQLQAMVARSGMRGTSLP
jgi:polar amino acid transport system substrate-binding protein